MDYCCNSSYWFFRDCKKTVCPQPSHPIMAYDVSSDQFLGPIAHSSNIHLGLTRDRRVTLIMITKRSREPEKKKEKLHSQSRNIMQCQWLGGGALALAGCGYWFVVIIRWHKKVIPKKFNYIHISYPSAAAVIPPLPCRRPLPRPPGTWHNVVYMYV